MNTSKRVLIPVFILLMGLSVFLLQRRNTQLLPTLPIDPNRLVQTPAHSPQSITYLGGPLGNDYIIILHSSPIPTEPQPEVTVEAPEIPVDTPLYDPSSNGCRQFGRPSDDENDYRPVSTEIPVTSAIP